MFGKSLPHLWHLYANSITGNPSGLWSQNSLVTWMDKITRYKPLGFLTQCDNSLGVRQNEFWPMVRFKMQLDRKPSETFSPDTLNPRNPEPSALTSSPTTKFAPMNGFSGTCEQQTNWKRTKKRKNGTANGKKKRNCKLKKTRKMEQKNRKKNGKLPNPFPRSSKSKNGICFDVKAPKPISFWPWKRMRLWISAWNRLLPLACFEGKGARVCFLLPKSTSVSISPTLCGWDCLAGVCPTVPCWSRARTDDPTALFWSQLPAGSDNLIISCFDDCTFDCISNPFWHMYITSGRAHFRSAHAKEALCWDRETHVSFWRNEEMCYRRFMQVQNPTAPEMLCKKYKTKDNNKEEHFADPRADPISTLKINVNCRYRSWASKYFCNNFGYNGNFVW